MENENNSLVDVLYIAAIIVMVAASVLLLDGLTGGNMLKRNAYNSYTLQANAWLSGRLDLGRDYSHLELAYYKDKVFVSFPPFPSVALLPFALIFGEGTPDHLIALIVAALAAVYSFKLCRGFGLSHESSLFLALSACIGSNFLYISVRGGWVWFIAQLMAFLFTVMSFYYAKKETQSKVPGFLAPLFLACAVGCRPFQIVCAPVTAYLMYARFKQNGGTFGGFARKLTIWVLPAALLCAFYLALNYARFGSPFEFGHNYLPEFAEDAQFGLKYLSDNVKNLLRLPSFKGGVLTFERFNGTAFWLVSPPFLALLLVYAARAFLPKKVFLSKPDAILFSIIPPLIAAHLFLICLHRTMGGWHFGNRYTVDAIPVALIGLANAWERDRAYGRAMDAAFIPLMFAGFLINATGTVWFYN